MPRNKHFHPAREPFRNEDSLELLDSKTQGPFSFLNPTQARYQHNLSAAGKVADSDSDQNVASQVAPNGQYQHGANVQVKWSSRNNRKGRHAIAVTPASSNHPEANVATPRAATHWRSILHVLWLMLAYYPVWDISWWVAYIFTWGSIVWVLNATFVFFPDILPNLTFHNEVLSAGGITAFVGATIFEIGSVLLMFEAVNEKREGCFGWAMEQAYDKEFHHHDHKARAGGLVLRPHACSHHHANKKNFVGQPHAIPTSAHADIDAEKQTGSSGKSWTWFPSWHELKTHYFHDIGFLACTSQFCGATIFWISGFTALPGINNKMSQGLLDGIYWFPQVLGGCGFIISGWLFMTETQKHWWLPALNVLGWHIGFWNLIGGIGFTLSPAFGFDTASWAQYQAGCSTYWASWAFLIGSVIQLYESLDKNPVTIEKPKN